MMYERSIYQFLTVYRFFAFAIAVVLTQAIPLGEGDGPAPRIYVILPALGIYTILKVFSPIRWRHKSLMTYTVLLGDLAVSIALVLYTGGLNSGFLLYALLPVITASLLFELRTALAVATLFCVPLVVAHTGLSQFSDRFAWVMDDNYLPLLIVYIMACFLIATLTYRTNLNIHQRIERDAILVERRRMKQEMHDGVAQALTFLNLKIKLLKDSISSHNTQQALDGLADIKRLVGDTYDDIRESIDQLSADGRTLSLIPTLSGYIRQFSRENSIQVHFDAPLDPPQLSDTAQLQLLRIAQEGLTNVRKHSEASEAWVEVKLDGGELRLSVTDNGQGLPDELHEGENNSKSFHGTTIMRESREHRRHARDLQQWRTRDQDHCQLTCREGKVMIWLP